MTVIEPVTSEMLCGRCGAVVNGSRCLRCGGAPVAAASVRPAEPRRPSQVPPPVEEPAATPVAPGPVVAPADSASTAEAETPPARRSVPKPMVRPVGEERPSPSVAPPAPSPTTPLRVRPAVDRRPIIRVVLRILFPLFTLATVVAWFLNGLIFQGLAGAVSMGLVVLLALTPRRTGRFVAVLILTVVVGLTGLTIAMTTGFSIAISAGRTMSTVTLLPWLQWSQGLWLPLALFVAIWCFATRDPAVAYAFRPSTPGGRSRSYGPGGPHGTWTKSRARPAGPSRPKPDYSDHNGHEPWRVPQGPDFVPEDQRDPQRQFPEELRKVIRARAGYRCEAVYWDWSLNEQAGGWQRCSTRSHKGEAPLEADHIYPHATGGRSVLANAQALCHMHNVQKGTQVPTAEYVQALVASRREYFPEDQDPRVSKW